MSRRCSHDVVSLIRRYYNAPEILLGLREITYEADVWSFALTWLRLLGIQITTAVISCCVIHV